MGKGYEGTDIGQPIRTITPIAMNQDSAPHSFRRLLQTKDMKYEEYVMSQSRYVGLVRFLDDCLGKDRRKNVVDIGCGAGIVSRGLAGKFHWVTGIDANADNVGLATSLTTDAGLGNVTYKYGLATQLPVDSSSMDLAVLNGVLEWVGCNNEGKKPEVLQMRVLAEVLRVLRPGGVLYLAIENRWHPRTILRDPHTGIPLVNALPRRVADIVSRKISGKPFQAYIYGRHKLEKLLSAAGFTEIHTFVPFPGYQHPFAYIPLRPRQASLRAIDSIDALEVQEALKNAGRQQDINKAIGRLRRRAQTGVLGVLAHDFSLLARKAGAA